MSVRFLTSEGGTHFTLSTATPGDPRERQWKHFFFLDAKTPRHVSQHNMGKSNAYPGRCIVGKQVGKARRRIAGETNGETLEP